MRLASDPIKITVDGVSATLRPSLRAAYYLQQRHGLALLIEGVMNSDVSMIADLIDHGTDDTASLAALLREIDKNGVVRLDPLKPVLIQFIAALLCIDPDDTPEDEATKAMPYDEFFESCFEIGTGWLGWSPAETWNATPAEILAAQRGLIAKLKAIHGSADEQAEYDPRQEVSEAEARAGIARLAANAKRGKR